MDPLISFGGIASGLDSNAIISALVAFRARPIDLLANQQSKFQSLKTRYQSLKSKVDNLRDAANDIKLSSDLLEFDASSSKTGVLTASANGFAKAGSYTFKVGAVASAEVEASNGYADFDTTAIGSGSLKITYAGTLHDITIAAGSTLDDIADEINDADAGVSASIINTGVGSTPYQLLLTGADTGTANSISVDTSGFTSAGTALTFSQTQAAANSSVTFGGVTFERSSNTVDDIIAGLTLNLLNANTGTETTVVTVTANVDDIAAKIQAYVDAHNDLVAFINSESQISDVTSNAGAFTGELTARLIKDKLLSLHGLGDFPGGGSFSTLGALGIELDKDGTLTFSQTQLESAIQKDLGGATAALTKVGDFFDESGFQTVDVDQLAAGTYDVAITTAATKASASAGAAFTTPLAQAETLTITVGAGGTPITIELEANQTLTQAIAEINARLDESNAGLVVSNNGGTLQFKATQYGSDFNFKVTSDVASGGTGIGSSLATFTGNGIDVAGTINGEAATGEGQKLTANTGTSVAGASIKFTGNAATTSKLTVGPDGFFQRVDDLLGSFLAPITGTLDSRLGGLDDTIDSLGDRIDSLNDRLENYKTSLQKRFSNLEAVIGKLQSSQSFLALTQSSLGGQA